MSEKRLEELRTVAKELSSRARAIAQEKERQRPNDRICITMCCGQSGTEAEIAATHPGNQPCWNIQADKELTLEDKIARHECYIDAYRKMLDREAANDEIQRQPSKNGN